MAITFVQQKAVEQSPSAVTSFTSSAMTVSAGNAIVAWLTAGADTTLAASDSKSDSYAAALTKSTVGIQVVGVAVAKTIAGGSTTFTVTPGTSSFCSIGVGEYAGMNTTAPAEATNTGGANSTAISPGAVNPATASDLYVAAFTMDGASAQTFGFNVSGEGWNTRGNQPNTAAQPLGSQDLIASGSKTGSASITIAANWCAVVATFKAGVAGASRPIGSRPFPFKPGSYSQGLGR